MLRAGQAEKVGRNIYIKANRPSAKVREVSTCFATNIFAGQALQEAKAGEIIQLVRD